MAWLDEYRKVNPWAADYSDADLITYKAEQTGVNPADFAQAIGYSQNAPGFWSTLRRSAGSLAGGVGEIYGDISGNHSNALSNFAEDVEFRNPSGINSFQDIADNPGLALAEATANGLTFLVPANGLQLAGQGLKAAKYLNAARAVDNPVTQAAVAGLPSLAGIGEDQRASGQGENLWAKYGGAGVVGAIENLGGIQRLAGINRATPGIQETVNNFGKTPWRTVGKTVGRSMLEEGAEELAQNPIEQWAGYKDPTTSQNMYETALGGAMGALGGLGFGAYHGGRSGMQHSAIRRDIATDLLNTDQSFGRQQNLAQWESAFRNKAGEDGQQWYGDFMNTQNDARLANTTTWNEPLADYQQRVAEAGNPFMGEGPTADFVNSQLGIGQKPVQQHYASAYNQRLPEPVIVPDSNGNPITISTVGEAYDYQHGMGKFAPQEAKVDALGYPISPYQPVTASSTPTAAPSWEQFAVNPAANIAPMPAAPAPLPMVNVDGVLTPVQQGTPSAPQTQQVAPQAVATPAAQTGTQQTAAPAAQGVAQQPASRLDAFKQAYGVNRKDARNATFLNELDKAKAEGQLTDEEHKAYEQKLADAWKVKDTKKSKNAVAAHNAMAKEYVDFIKNRAVAPSNLTDEEKAAAGWVKKITVKGGAEHVEWIPPKEKRATEAAQAEVPRVDPEDIENPEHEKAVRMHLAGDNLRTIAATLGKSHETWRKVLLDYGYDAKSKVEEDSSEAETGSAFTADENAAYNDDATHDETTDANPDVHDNDEYVDNSLENQGINIRSAGSNSVFGRDRVSTETKLERQQREEREALQANLDSSRAYELSDKVANADVGAATELLGLLNGSNGLMIAQQMRAKFAMPASVQTPQDIVEFIAAKQAAAVAAHKAQFAEAAEHWGEGFDTLPEAAKLAFVDAMNGLGDLINTPSVLRQVKGDINNEFVHTEAVRDAEGVPSSDAQRPAGGRNDEGQGNSGQDQKAVPVVSKKKRRVAVADEAAGRSDSEGQAGEVTAEVDPRPVLELTGESSEDVLANETAPIFELQVQDGRQLTLDLTAGETEEAPYVNPDQMALDFDAAPQETTTPEQRKQAQEHADSLGGVVAWQDGDIALLRGFSALTGQPIYAASNGKYRTRVAIDAYTGNLFTPDQRDELINVAAKLEAEAQEKHAAEPFAPFTGSNIGASKSVPPGVVGVVKGWTKLLGITANVYVTTVEDAKANIEAFTGPYRAISSAALNNNEGGSMRRLPNGDYYIAFAGKPSRAAVLETVAHELGHVHEREVFEKADAATKQAIRNEYTQWLAKQKGVSAKELVASLRARKMGKLTGGLDGLTADQLTSYWKSFGEWYADQVSRWANTAEKPVGVVETFFDKLGKALRSFYNKLVNEKYLPNKAFAAYLERTNGASKDSQAGEVDGKLYRRETLVFTDSTGQHFSEEVESIDIRNTEDLLNALDDVAYNQLSGALDYVSGFHATDSLDAYAYPNGDGTYKIVLPRALLSGHPETLTRVLHHELAHVADAADAINGGKNSSGIAMGVMVQKAKALYDKLPANSKLKKHLEYPFHSKYPESGSAKMQRTELYAQLVSAYLDPELSAELRAVHPTLFNFAESIVNEIEEQYQEDAESSDASVSPSRVVHQGNHAVVRQRGAAAQQTHDQFGKTGTQVMDDARDVVSRGFKWFMSLHDLVSEYKAQLPSASSWYDSVRATIATRNKMEASAEAIAARAGKLKSEHLTQLNKFLAQSTLDQKWGYDATFTRSDGTKHVVKADPQMAQAFNRLPVEVQNLVKDIFAHGETMKDTKYTTMRELGIKDPILQAGALTGPYAPLKRFGDHIVVLKSKELVAAEKADDQKKVDELKKDGKHYVVSSFDTKGQAKAFERENAAKYESAVTFKGSEKLDLGHQMNTQTLQKLQASLKLEKIDKRAKEQFENLLKDMYLRAFDEHSARMSGLKRMNRAGFNEDMVRSFLSHARAEAGFLANMKHGAKTNEEYYKIEQEAKQDRYAGQDAFNAITQHYVANLEHKDTPIQDRVMALTTFQQLATNPAYHIQNLLQPVMVSVPRLAADFNNYAGAWTALRQGYAIVRKAVSGGLINDAKIDLSKVENQKLRDMLQAASDAGLLDVGMDEDLTKFESTQTGYGAVDKTSALVKKVVHKMRQTARRVEATNRISTAVAAFNMSYAKEANEAKATAYAISVLQDTQGDFSKTDAPLIIKKLPKFVVQYRKFQLMMAAHYVKAFRDAFRSEDPETRAVGRRTLAISLGHAFMASGVMGLPLMNLVGLAFAASGDDDEPKDLERSLREWIGDADTANFLLRSPLYFMGLDAKLSQDKIFSILPYADWNLTSKKGVMNLGAGLAGPSGSNAMKMADGLGNMAKGEYYDGLIGLLPSGLSNGVKAFEMANKGYTLKNGDVMVKPEDINEFGLLMDSMGLKSPGTRRMDWYKNQQWEVKQFYSDRTKEIEHQYADAAKSGDTEKLSELRQDWQDLQAGKDHLRYIFGDQHDELKRQPLSNLLKYPQTQAKREHKLQKSVPQEL